MSSLKNKIRQVLILGSFGLELRSDRQWKAKGLGEQSGKQFTLQEEGLGKWRVNGISSGGSRKRERFMASDLTEAVEQASRLLFGQSDEKGHPQLDLASAFDRCFKTIGGSETHRQQQISFAGYFCHWAEKHTYLTTGTITIQGHAELGEGVKNQYRIRRIPLPQMVWHRLRQLDLAKGKVVPYEEDYVAFGKLLKRALLKWQPGCEIAPKDQRKTLQTHAMEHATDEGWNTYLVDRYVGHAPKTLAERHYFGDKHSRMVEVFRVHVAAKIDALIERIQGSRRHEMARVLEIQSATAASA